MRRILSGVAAVCLVVGMTVSCSTLPGGLHVQLGISGGKRFAINDATDSTGWGKGTHLYLSHITEDKIAMTYWIAGDGTSRGTAGINWPAYTENKGGSWQFGNPFIWTKEPDVPFPIELKKGDSFKDFYLGTFFSSATYTNGTKVFFTTGGPVNDPEAFYRIVSRDNGETWSPPEKVTITLPEGLTNRPSWLYVESAAAVGPDNTMYTVAYGKPGPGTSRSVYMFSSTNEGATLNYHSTVAGPADSPWGNEGPCEPALLMVDTGSFIVVARTGMLSDTITSGNAFAADMILCRSDDLGKTWSHRRMGIPGVMPKLRQLQNGVVVMITGRPGNSLYFSTNKGKSFGREVALTAPHIKTTGYGDFIEVSPNRILVVYDIINSPLNKIWLWEPTMGNGIYGKYYDISYRFGGD